MKRIFLPLVLLLLLLVFLAGLPSLLSTSYGKNVLLQLATKKSHQQISIDSLRFSWLGPQTLSNVRIQKGNFEIAIATFSTDLPFWKLFRLFSSPIQVLLHTTSITSLQNCTLATLIPQNNLAFFNLSLTHKKKRPLQLDFSGKSEQGGDISLQVLSQDLSHAQLFLSCTDLPSLLLDQFIPFFVSLPENFFTHLFGSLIQMKANAEIENQNGSLFFTLSSPLVHWQMQGNYKEGIVTLSDDLKIDLFLTETLSRYFLKEVMPLFITAESAKNPIHLTIFKEGFFLPLSPFSLKEIKVQRALLDVGQIRAKNEEGLALVMGIMKLHLPSHIQEMDIWATPVVLSLDEGILSTNRMDALLDHSIHICTWGTINLLSKNIDMTLGLTAEALQETFHFANLPKDYVLTVPMKGTPDHLSIDSSVAAAKIAKLMALKATNSGFLNKLFGTIDKEENVPPPQFPFPWEGSKKKKAKKPIDLFFE